MALDAVAHRYHSDPHTVAQWSPERFGLALECVSAREAVIERRFQLVAGGDGIVFPVWDLGR